MNENIENLDMEPIVFKLIHPEEGEGWSLEQADKAVERYRQFLELCLLYPGKPIVPTQDIDEVWHYHILDTAKYRSDCDRIFGRPLDHFPYFGLRGEDDERNLKQSFEETKRLFELHFDTQLSSKEQGCGSGCNDSLCSNTACDSESCTPNPSPDDIALRPRPVRVAS